MANDESETSRNSERARKIHGHLVQIEKDINAIIALVDDSRLAAHEKRHLKSVFQGVLKICLAECEGPTTALDYYPEIE